MAAKLTELMDPALDVAGDEGAVVARVKAAVEPPMMVALAVVGYKRRLGSVPVSALAADKRMARRAGHALRTVVEAAEDEQLDWQVLTGNVSDEHRAAAAVVEWKVWLPEQAALCRREAQYCATWVIRVNLQSRIVRRIAHRLDGATKRLTQLEQLLVNE